MNSKTRITLTAVLALALLAVPLAQAQTPPVHTQSSKKPILANATRVVDAFGTVEKKISGATGYTKLSSGDILSPQTTLHTGENSAILLLLPGGHHFRIGENSVVLLQELGKDKSFAFKVLSGQVWSLVRKVEQPTKFEVTTPSAVAGVTGTLFGVGYDLETDQSTVSTEEGSVNVALASGGWKGSVVAGKFVQYLRNPQPNIRLRSPEILAQNADMRRMWKLLRGENWTRRDLPANMPPRLNRSQEMMLRKFFRILPGSPGGPPPPPPPGFGVKRGPFGRRGGEHE